MKARGVAAVALFAAVFSLATRAGGAQNAWNDSTGDHKWGTPGNWSLERCPADGDTVTIPKEMHAIIVDDDSAASFASAITIDQSSEPVTCVDIEATTNITLRCVMTTYASFRLKSAIDVAVATNCQDNFRGYNVIEKGRFLMSEGAPISANNRYNYGRFAVSNDAALVARYPANHRLFRLYADGMVTNMNSSAATLTITQSSSPVSYIAGPIGGNWVVMPSCSLNITGTNNVALTGKIQPFDGATLGIAKFGVANSVHSSIGAIGLLNPSYYGSIVKYLGTGETTDKGFVIAGSTSCEQELDGGDTGGLVYNGDFSYVANASYNAVMHRFVFSGSGTAKTNVLGGAWEALKSGCSTYVTKRGPSTWRFNSSDGRKNAGAIAVEEGTLQFDSLDERGKVCSLGTANILHERYSGTYNAGRTVDYAYLLGTTNAAGMVNSTGTMEYVGARWGFAEQRPFRLLGDGRIVATTDDLAIRGMQAESAGDKRLTLSAAEGTYNSLGDVRDGPGRVSIVKDGAGAWTIGGVDVSGSVEVKAGTLNVVSTNAPLEYYRFTVMATPTSASQVKMDELAFFDNDGVRLNPLMNWKHESHSTPGYYYVRGDAYELEPNEMCHGVPNGSPYFYGATASYGMSYLCNNSASDRLAFTFLLFYTQTALLVPQLDKPTTHISVVLRLPEGSAGRAVKYDFLSSNDDSNANSPSAYKLEGSPDGRVWTLLDYQTDHPGPTLKNRWYSDETLFNASVAPTGFRIATHSDCVKAFEHVANISVAAGATLKACGETAPIARLTVDAAAGAGTISGFALADSGTLVVENEPSGPRPYFVSLDLSGCTDAANIAGWTLLVDGVDVSARRTVTVDAGGIRISHKGLMMLIR